jgi:hypothetical protein
VNGIGLSNTLQCEWGPVNPDEENSMREDTHPTFPS